jgi:hypothetical protein
MVKTKNEKKKGTLQTMNPDSHIIRKDKPATFNPALLAQRPERRRVPELEIHGGLLHIPCCLLLLKLRHLSQANVHAPLLSSHKLSKNLKISLSDIMPSTRLLPASTMNTRRTPSNKIPKT